MFRYIVYSLSMFHVHMFNFSLKIYYNQFLKMRYLYFNTKSSILRSIKIMKKIIQNSTILKQNRLGTVKTNHGWNSTYTLKRMRKVSGQKVQKNRPSAERNVQVPTRISVLGPSRRVGVFYRVSDCILISKSKYFCLEMFPIIMVFIPILSVSFVPEMYLEK